MEPATGASERSGCGGRRLRSADGRSADRCVSRCVVAGVVWPPIGPRRPMNVFQKRLKLWPPGSESEKYQNGKDPVRNTSLSCCHVFRCSSNSGSALPQPATELGLIRPAGDNNRGRRTVHHRRRGPLPGCIESRSSRGYRELRQRQEAVKLRSSRETWLMGLYKPK